MLAIWSHLPNNPTSGELEVPAGTLRRQRRPRRPGEQAERPTSAKESHDAFFWRRRGARFADPPLSLKTCRQKFTFMDLRSSQFSLGVNFSHRARRALIKFRLMCIHPNPGPRSRDKTEEGKKRRRERRKERRKEKRVQKEEEKFKHLKVATWNVQRMSLGTRNERKLKSVAVYASKNKWDTVLLSEVRASGKGTVWLGAEDNLTAIVYTEKAAILLRDKMLKAWCQEGQLVKSHNRSIAIKVKNMVLISTYMPVYKGNNEQEIEMAREDLKELTKWAARDDLLLIGGDFNAHVGAGEERPGVCGRFGLRESNYQGRLLLEWCEDNNLCHVNSFFNQRRRGTWFHTILGRWYEIDGFIMKNNQRHKHARRMYTVAEASLSDHKPKLIQIETKVKLPKRKREKKQPRIKWEMLKNPEHKTQYKEKVQQILEEREQENYDNLMNVNNNETTEWNDIVQIVNTAALEVCGEMEKHIENEWMIDKDTEVNIMRNRITTAINNRNDLTEQIRNGQNDPEGQQDQIEELIQRLNEQKEELKEARKDLKRKTRQWEMEYWEGIINQCQEAADRGDAGTVYKTLKTLGQRGKTTAPNTTTLTKEDFRRQFKQISEKRFENNPEEIDAVLEEVTDISNSQKATEWREQLEEVPSSEEICKQMKKMRDSSPGEDGTRLIYLLEAGPEVINMVVEMVQFMFLNGAEKWEDSLKLELMIPLHKKGNINNENNYRVMPKG